MTSEPLQLANAAFEAGRFVEAYEALRLLAGVDDAARGAHIKFAWTRERLGRFDLATPVWQRLRVAEPENPTARWRALNCAVEVGEPEALDELVDAALAGEEHLGLLESAGQLLGGSIDPRLSDIIERLAAHPFLGARLNAALLRDSTGDVATAATESRAVLADHDALGTDSPLSTLAVARLAVRFDRERFEHVLADLIADVRLRPTAGELRTMRRWMLRPNRFGAFVELCRSLPRVAQDPQTEAAIVEGLIAIGDDDAADARVSLLVETPAVGSIAVESLRAWQLARHERFDEARSARESVLWPHTGHLRSQRTSQRVRSAGERRPQTAPVVCIAAVRDERQRIEGFLDHHRGLGVERFWMIDDHSVDGTAEWLAEQPDVDLWVGSGSYKEAGQGVAWFIAMAAELPGDAWVCVVDADELLVLPPDMPTVETFLDSLPPTDEAVHSNVVDVFVGPDGAWYFDADYVMAGQVGCPWRMIVGGVRSRLLDDDSSPGLVKTPLVRAGKFASLWSTHEVLPVRVASPSVAMLHTKLDGGMSSRSMVRNRRSFVALASGNDSIELTANSVRYEGPEQLAELGLTGAPVPVGTHIRRGEPEALVRVDRS